MCFHETLVFSCGCSASSVFPCNHRLHLERNSTVNWLVVHKLTRICRFYQKDENYIDIECEHCGLQSQVIEQDIKPFTPEWEEYAAEHAEMHQRLLGVSPGYIHLGERAWDSRTGRFYMRKTELLRKRSTQSAGVQLVKLDGALAGDVEAARRQCELARWAQSGDPQHAPLLFAAEGNAGNVIPVTAPTSQPPRGPRGVAARKKRRRAKQAAQRWAAGRVPQQRAPISQPYVHPHRQAFVPAPDPYSSPATSNMHSAGPKRRHNQDNGYGTSKRYRLDSGFQSMSDTTGQIPAYHHGAPMSGNTQSGYGHADQGSAYAQPAYDYGHRQQVDQYLQPASNYGHRQQADEYFQPLSAQPQAIEEPVDHDAELLRWYDWYNTDYRRTVGDT